MTIPTQHRSSLRSVSRVAFALLIGLGIAVSTVAEAQAPTPAAGTPTPGPVAPPVPVSTRPGDEKPPVPVEAIARLRPFIEALRRDAERQGVTALMFDRVMEPISLDPEVMDRLSNQPELLQAPWDYIGLRVSETRIANGRAKLAEHGPLLAELEATYGVDRHVIVAIWGMESSYGAFQGTFGIVRSLTTLAVLDQRRPQFWRNELLKALVILQNGDTTPERMIGSWAGAMGHVQFMPSSFLALAVDHDRDGRRDIWGSVPDALASTANYLKVHGKWRPALPWGFEVVLPEGFAYADNGPGVGRTLAAWAALGVTLPGGREPPAVDGGLTLLLPAGARGPAFLITPNFRSILSYNNSTAYALAVGHLADRIAGGPPIAGFWPTDDAPLDKAMREELQRRLNALGFEIGTVDGLFGAQTREAIRAYQRRAGLPVDGHAGTHLLKRLREDTSGR